MRKKLIIDGNNLLHRAFWAYKKNEVEYKEGSQYSVYVFLNILKSYVRLFEPSEITVYGTEEELATIHHAWVTVKGEGISASFTENRPYVFMDENSNELSLKHCSTDVQHIATTLTVNTIKEVAIALDIIPGGGATEANCEIKMDIDKITLSGDTDELESMEKLIIGSIDLSDYSEDFSYILMQVDTAAYKKHKNQ